MSVLVFVHGFGGLDHKPAFVVEAEKYIQQYAVDCSVQNIAWESQKIRILKAGLLFDVARKNTEQAAHQLEKKKHHLHHEA